MKGFSSTGEHRGRPWLGCGEPGEARKAHWGPRKLAGLYSVTREALLSSSIKRLVCSAMNLRGSLGCHA